MRPSDELWMELIKFDAGLAERLWSGDLTSEEMPEWGTGLEALVSAARGPAVPDELQGEAAVVERMRDAALRSDGHDPVSAVRATQATPARRVSPLRGAVVAGAAVLGAATAAAAATGFGPALMVPGLVRGGGSPPPAEAPEVDARPNANQDADAGSDPGTGETGTCSRTEAGCSPESNDPQTAQTSGATRGGRDDDGDAEQGVDGDPGDDPSLEPGEEIEDAADDATEPPAPEDDGSGTADEPAEPTNPDEEADPSEPPAPPEGPGRTDPPGRPPEGPGRKAPPSEPSLLTRQQPGSELRAPVAMPLGRLLCQSIGRPPEGFGMFSICSRPVYGSRRRAE